MKKPTKSRIDFESAVRDLKLLRQQIPEEFRLMFLDAIIGGNEPAVSAMLKAGAPADCFFSLELIQKRGGFTSAPDNVERSPDFTDKEERWSTPLREAALHGHAEIVNVLLKNGANPEKMCCYKMDALEGAVRSGDVGTVNAIIAAGSSLDKVYGYEQRFYQNGYTALMLAIRKGNMDCLKALIEHGAPLYPECVYRFSYFKQYTDRALLTATLSKRLDMVDYLLENGADVNEENPRWNEQACERKLFQDRTPLTQAIYDGSIEIIQRLIKAGAEDSDLIDYMKCDADYVDKITQKKLLALFRGQIAEPDRIRQTLGVVPKAPRVSPS